MEMKPKFVPAATSWSAEDDEKLKAMWMTHTSLQLINVFGRSRSAIVARAHRLGMKKGVSKKDRKRGPTKVPTLKTLFVKDPTYAISRVKVAASKPSTEIRKEPFKGVHLTDLKRHHCRYMHESDTLMFCGHDVKPGSSYCENHHKYMFRGIPALTPMQMRKLA